MTANEYMPGDCVISDIGQYPKCTPINIILTLFVKFRFDVQVIIMCLTVVCFGLY